MGKYHYDKNYKPPAPTCNIKISTNLAKLLNKDEDPSREVKMLVDTGADMCIIPKSIVNELEEQLGTELPYDLIKAKDFDGQTSTHKVYNLIAFIRNNKEHKHILDFLEIDDEDGILGRDLLNNYSITLNGPKHPWTLKKK